MERANSKTVHHWVQVLYVVEGDLRGLGMYEAMMGAMINANLRNSCVFRTADLEETAVLVAHLTKKLASHPAPVVSGGGLQPPPTKKQRCADNVFLLQLMCVPSISEKIAEKLVEHFVDLETLQASLRESRSGGKSFPQIRLSEKACLGKARVSILRKHLLRAD